jgi:hypothetical protein
MIATLLIPELPEKIRPIKKSELLNLIANTPRILYFVCCYGILHGACPELNNEILHFVQNDRRRVQDDHYHCRVNKIDILIILNQLVLVLT